MTNSTDGIDIFSENTKFLMGTTESNHAIYAIQEINRSRITFTTLEFNKGIILKFTEEENDTFIEVEMKTQNPNTLMNLGYLQEDDEDLIISHDRVSNIEIVQYDGTTFTLRSGDKYYLATYPFGMFTDICDEETATKFFVTSYDPEE